MSSLQDASILLLSLLFVLQMPGMNLQLSLVCRWPSALWVPSLWHHWCATHIRTKRRASWSTQVWNLIQKWCWSSCHDYSPILLWSVYRIRVGHKGNLSSLQLIIWQHRWHLNVGIGRSVRIASRQVGAMTRILESVYIPFGHPVSVWQCRGSAGVVPSTAQCLLLACCCFPLASSVPFCQNFTVKCWAPVF